MARTSPAPNIPPIPGMCPGVAVLAGGAGAGGAGGKGSKKGKGKKKGSKKKGKKDANGNKKKGGKGCGDPIDPITGRMFLDLYDFGFGGPLPLRWIRNYSSRAAGRGGDLGFGWSHAFGWQVLVKRRSTHVFDAEGGEQEFEALPKSGEPITNGFGWTLQREGQGLRLRVEDRYYVFGAGVGGLHFLEAVMDRHGNAIRFERNARGTITRMVDSAGRLYRVDSDSAGRVVSIAVATDPANQNFLEVVRYGYDDLGDLSSATDAEGHVARYAYDAHLMIEHRHPCGLSYCYRYDGRTPEAWCVESWGEYVGETDPALEHPIPPRPSSGPDRRPVKGINYVRLTYVKDQFYTEVENGLGGIERYFGDDSGRVLKEIDAAGGVTERAFDEETGELIQESLPNGDVRAVERDEDGNSLGFTEARGQVEIFDDEDGLEVRVDTADETMVRREFDRFGQLVFVEHGDGTTEQYEYDERGFVQRIVDRSGGRTVYYHDAMGNCVCVERPDGSVEVSEFDYLGRRIAHVDGANRRTEWRYDGRGEVIWKRQADGSEIHLTLDANAKPTMIAEPGRVTRCEYGGLGWLTKVTTTDGEFDLRYDVEGHLTYVRNPRGQIFRQKFDPAGRCVEVESFEGVVQRAGWDPATRPVWIETALGRETRAYDAANRLVSAELADGEAVTLDYAPRVLQHGNGKVVVEQELDHAAQIVRDRQGNHETKIAWAGGKVTAIASDVGLPLTFASHANGRTDRISAGTTHVQLNMANGTDRLTLLGDDLVLRRTYGATSQLTRLVLARRDRSQSLERTATSADPNVLAWRTYEYDLAQSLRTETRSDGTVINFDTNLDGQVTARRVTRAGTVIAEETIRYDRAGTPILEGVQLDANARPAVRGNERFAYDELGRLVRRETDAGEWQYEWSAASTLTRVVAPDHVVEMDYDARGRRMRKRLLREAELVRSTTYVYSNNVVLHEVDDQTGATRTYLREDGAWEPVGHVDLVDGVATSCFYVNGPAGAIDFAVDARGQVVWDAERTAYGDFTPTISRVDVSVRFANQHYDADVGLVYNLRRWYDPRVGLYVSPDPLLLKGTLNPRDYAKNPYVWIDPMGLTHVHPGPTNNPPWPPNGHAPTPGHPSGIPGAFANNGNYLLGPGHWATEGANVGGQWVPGYAVANGAMQTQQGNWPPDVQDTVDNAGRTFGCHSCGTKDPGTKNGHFIPDHQPQASGVRRANAAGHSIGQVRLYPHCLNCSKSQFRQAGRGSGRSKIARAILGGRRNTRHQNPNNVP